MKAPRTIVDCSKDGRYCCEVGTPLTQLFRIYYQPMVILSKFTHFEGLGKNVMDGKAVTASPTNKHFLFDSISYTTPATELNLTFDGPLVDRWT